MGERFKEISNIGARVLLSGMILSSAACGSSAPQEKLKCPITRVEVSRLVGGNPVNWKMTSEQDGYSSWTFESEEGQVLNGARIGRVDTPDIGQLMSPQAYRGIKRAWYVCTTRDQSIQDMQSPESISTPVPSPQGL